MQLGSTQCRNQQSVPLVLRELILLQPLLHVRAVTQERTKRLQGRQCVLHALLGATAAIVASLFLFHVQAAIIQ